LSIIPSVPTILSEPPYINHPKVHEFLWKGEKYYELSPILSGSALPLGTTYTVDGEEAFEIIENGIKFTDLYNLYYNTTDWKIKYVFVRSEK
jgi:hypothetical protein